jgi:hypothetical protein
MNERILELMKQADYPAPELALRAHKLAELIVRECVEIALEQKKWVEDMKVHNPHDEVWNKARIQQSQHIVDKIKEHFGVAE